MSKPMKKDFGSTLEIPEINHFSESDESLSLPNTPPTPRRRYESDESQDVKSSSGSSVTLRKAFRRTFSWTKRKHHIGNHEKIYGDACKIILLGFSGVGKTAAVVRFLTGRYIHEYQSKKEETYYRNVELDGRHVALELTSIAEKMRAFDDRMLECSTGVAMVYSVVDMMSFYYIQHLFESIGARLSGPVILVGAKIDLGERRCVRKSSAMQLARENNCAYFETSAALDIGIKECFNCLMRKILVKDVGNKSSAEFNNNAAIFKKSRRKLSSAS